MIVRSFSSNNWQSEPKKLLSYLLKKHLGEKINKLEQKNITDENIINLIKETSNNLKNFLDDSSQKSK